MDYLIWSIEHDAWWRPGWMGYTRELSEAGRYGDAEAQEILARANRVQVNECKIPAPCVLGPLDLFAWIGEDEFGSGRVGLKQGRVPAGLIPLVVVGADREKISRPELVDQLQAQARAFGVQIRLARFTLVEDGVVRLEPK